MDKLALLDRLTDLISHSKQMESQIKAIQEEIEYIYKEISNPNEQDRLILKLFPNIIEQLRQLPKSNKFIDVKTYQFIKRSLVEIQDEIEDTSIRIENVFPERSDNAEENYFKDLHKYIDDILEKKTPSKYKSSTPYEDGLDVYSSGDLKHIEKRKAQAKEIQNEPYIGRIDYFDLNNEEAVSYYIGDQNFENDDQDLLVIRWSDDRANIFYENRIGQAVEYNDLGAVKLDYIRKIDTKNKCLKLHKPLEAGSDDEFLINNLSNKRGKIDEMELITSTISRSQNRLIRSNLNQLMIIQGSAGTGKSIIALYRISYILDKYRNKLRENSVAFFGPNNLFLKHISSALKGLGNEKITKTQIDEYLQRFLKVFKLSDNLYYEDMRIKGSIDYKNYIQYYTECLLGNIKPWLSTFKMNIADYKLTIHGIDVAIEYEKTLKANYNDRKNMLFNALSNCLKDAIATVSLIDKTLMSSSREYSKELANSYLAPVIDVSILDEFSELLSPDTIEELVITARLIKKENKKRENEFVPSAITKEARDSEDEVASLVVQDLKVYLDSLRSSVEKDIDENYYMWVCNHYKEIFDKLIDYELNQEIKKAFSDVIRANDVLYIEKLENIINTGGLEEVEKRIQNQYLHKANDRIKELARTVVDKTKDGLIDLVFEEAEKQLHSRLEKIIQQTYDAKIKFKQVYKVSNRKNETKKITFEKELKQFLSKKFFKNPQEIYREILKDSLKIQFNYSEKVHKLSVQKELTNHDLPALLLIMIMMQGTGYNAPFQYAVVDEAQDLRPFTIWAIRQLVSTDGLIMFGDLGQNLNQDNPIVSWEEYAPLLGDVNYYNLDTNFRSTKEIFDYSNAIIKPFAEGKYNLPDKCYLRGEKVREYVKGEFGYDEVLIKEIHKGLSESKSYETVAILCKEENEVNILKEYQPLKEFINKTNITLLHQSANEVNNNKQKLIIMTVKESKGLQFDYVIIPNYSAYSDSDYDLKLLYVATSRALHELVVLNKIK